MAASTLEYALRRDRLIVGAALAALTVLAWLYTLRLAGTMVDAPMGMEMPGMGGAGPMGEAMAPGLRPWSGIDFLFTFVMWAVMMIGMMTPSAAPMVLIYAHVGRRAAEQGKPLAATGFFAGGYLLAWTGFSLAATAGQWLLERALLLTPMMASASGVFSGLILVAAGLYQWTPQKAACLRHCQAPLSFIQSHGGFRRDPAGSLAVGFRHGLYCIGCCWALMALLFVGGIMNLLLIAAIAAFVLAEKVLPRAWPVSRLAGLVLFATGLWLLAGQLA
ncbi:DUF2182 domain-containing protein [Nitratireductor sp. ZSWI3]|uniref:DUF2182 domain-containing protein n=1 Tax=Nitratireductor sp. ZSWI3 TaxID=2966359 RepID=UPI00214FCE2F|nr:DUF2182 domain-containing protein [Nitratireductor sp. ZSWI3]MCR4265770.1 DUF2182 domain-containing protein [Nitratireductor sp. ZSWI3]